MAAAKKVEKAPKKFRITSPIEGYVGIGAGGVQFAYDVQRLMKGGSVTGTAKKGTRSKKSPIRQPIRQKIQKGNSFPFFIL